MTSDAQAGEERARRFRDAVLPYVDEAYTFAHYLMRNPADAEDVVRECYLRAGRHADSFGGPAMKLRLFAMLRNICHARLAPDGTPADTDNGERIAEARPADSVMPGWQDGALIRRLVVDLPTLWREAIVLRECCGMSYKEIAEIVGVPIGMVVSRLAGARSMMLAAWKAADSAARQRPTNPARGDVDRLRVIDRPRSSAVGASR
jgi:RNA polymerase sigma-70 factor, ECF subfamily